MNRFQLLKLFRDGVWSLMKSHQNCDQDKI
jgi:hypothetical protein